MDGRSIELLGQLENEAKELLLTIDALRSKSQNEAAEEIFLGLLEEDVIRVQEAWQRLVKHRRPIPERPLRGPFDPPEN